MWPAAAARQLGQAPGRQYKYFCLCCAHARTDRIPPPLEARYDEEIEMEAGRPLSTRTSTSVIDYTVKL